MLHTSCNALNNVTNLGESSLWMSALDTGKAKLGAIISFENLPRDRNANLWTRIENDCHLTLNELSALQNAVCSPAKSKIVHFLE